MTDKKRSNLISFKASEELLDKLEELRRGDESLSLVVKRIAEESVGMATPKTTVEDKVDQILDLLRGKTRASA
ncbi:hypothetical protein AMR41_00030 [Hapalosiphon sp. MRB220]|nr:hypothetical protein AMR41_00030 [Hapalosiphon sp. MRB220]